MAVPLIDISEHELALGDVIDRIGVSTDRFFSLPDFVTVSDMFTNPDRHIGDILRLSEFFYNTESVYGTCVDLMHELSFSGFQAITPKKYGQSFWTSLLKRINFSKVIDSAMFDYVLKGNVIGYIHWNKNKTYPVDIEILNPEAIHIENVFGSKKPAVFLKDTTSIKETRMTLSKLSPKQRKTYLANIPEDIAKGLERATGMIPLDPDNLWIVQRKRRPYKAWAVPFESRVYKDVILKNRLKQAEYATTDGFINMLWLFRIGSDKMPATKKVLKELKEQLTEMGSYSRMVQGHTFDAEVITPPTEIFNEKKYASVNSDILRGFGITSVLVDGADGTKTSWYSILGFIERIEYVRQDFEEAIESLFEEISSRSGKSNIPKVSFAKNLRDPKVYGDIMRTLYERGILSVQTYIEESGFDFDVEKDRKTEEKANKIDEIFFLPVNPNNMIDPKMPQNPGRNKESAEPQPPTPDS